MLDYLDWDSSLSLEQVFASSDVFSHPSYTTTGECLYRGVIKEDKNRSVLMLRDQNGDRCLTPSPYGLQTRVNEYGGKPYWLFGDTIIFANQADQCLYRQRLEQNVVNDPTVTRITPRPTDSQRYMYTDVQFLAEGSLLKAEGSYLAIIEVEESGQHDGSENRMFIGLVSHDCDADPVALIHGADFYSNLVISEDSQQIAWVQWQHPGMPWDETQLWTADLTSSGVINKRQIMITSDNASEPSICQLLFANNGRLFFSADYKNSSGAADFWSLHAYDFRSNRVEKFAQQVAADGWEFGYPHWVYGDSRIVQLDQQRLLAVGSRPEGDQLFIINQETYKTVAVGDAGATQQHLAGNGAGQILLLRLAKDSSTSLLELSIDSESSLEQRFIISPKNIDLDISCAEHISFPTSDGQQAHGFYYSPRNGAYASRTDPEATPPLIVMVHGGPTSRAYGHFDLQKQFWTSRGFAILDVNHRGSSGYGRGYRDALYGLWGERDAHDIIDGIKHLISQGRVDAKRVCIRGKSAGGYAVLRALTEFPSVFKAGACYYGIGNLVTLAETTHKFEKHYTDRLVNEVFDPAKANLRASKFYQRSPINKIGEVGSAMIIFQGTLDKVVPPAVAQEVVAALKSAELDYDYIEYGDEAHGFRQTNNNIDAMQKELAFYRRVLAD